MGGTMRVLVAGAGVAGSVAAMALHKAGFEPVVFEAYERGAGLAHGVYLTVAVNGLDARRAIDPDAPAPRYTGLGNTGGFTRAAQVPARPGDYAMVWGKHCFFGYTVSPDGEIWWFANPPSRTEMPRDELRRLTTDRLRDRLLDLLKADRTPGAEIVRATTADFPLTNQYDLPTVPTWHNGAMVVIGDAAHAVSPSSGQGASLAAEDAVVLAKCLRDVPGIPAALDEYERRRRPRVERIVAWAAGMNNTKRQGLVARLQRDLLLPLILKKAAGPGELAKMSWMFEHHVDWDTRVEAGGKERTATTTMTRAIPAPARNGARHPATRASAPAPTAPRGPAPEVTQRHH